MRGGIGHIRRLASFGFRSAWTSCRRSGNIRFWSCSVSACLCLCVCLFMSLSVCRSEYLWPGVCVGVCLCVCVGLRVCLYLLFQRKLYTSVMVPVLPNLILDIILCCSFIPFADDKQIQYKLSTNITVGTTRLVKHVNNIAAI